MSLGFGELDVSVNTLNLSRFRLSWARRLAIGAFHFRIALRGDFACGSFLGLLAEFPSQGDCLPFDNAVVGRSQEHALFDLFLDGDLRQLAQKLLFSRLSYLLLRVHAMAPSGKNMLRTNPVNAVYHTIPEISY